MAAVIKHLFKGYFWIFNDLADPRVNDLYFMTSPVSPFLIIVLYFYLIKNFLPKYMENRKAFDLQSSVVAFNFSQIVANAVLFYYAIQEVRNFDWTCQPVDYKNDYHLKLTYAYFITKITDLLDTIFFVLRKKSNQVSFLHLYHHGGMVGVIWIGVKFLAGGHSLFIGLANTLVHTVMYTYYLLTIWKPEYKQNLWWKKYITQMQLLQFVFFFFIFVQTIFNGCSFPKIVSFFLTGQSIFMMFLFGDFYWKAYMSRRKTSSLKKH